METAFLPVTREEMLERGWDRVYTNCSTNYWKPTPLPP